MSQLDPAAARAKLGLKPEQFKALRAFLDGKTFGITIVCDHTHTRTEEWAGRMGIDMEALGEQLLARKEELLRETESGPLPRPELTTMESTTV